jgi:hypothetical protein
VIGDVAREDPRVAGGNAAGSLAVDADFVHRMACNRAMRSAVAGCVENRRIMLWPVNGLMMNMWAVAGGAAALHNPFTVFSQEFSLSFQSSPGFMIRQPGFRLLYQD